MFEKASIRDLSAADLKNKRVLVRVDFNVPFLDGHISDDSRIRGALPTLTYLLEKGASLVLVSHLGRPKGKADAAFTLAPVAAHLGQLLSQDVAFFAEAALKERTAAIVGLKPGQIAMLENIRFNAEEERNDSDFSAQLAQACDLFVQDAFGTVHRAHASTMGVTAHLPSYAGLLLEKELAALQGLFAADRRPVLAIVGGAKVSSKLSILTCLLDHVDVLAIGGGMAYTFLKAQGKEVGGSLVEDALMSDARDVMAQAEKKGVRLCLPQDHVCSPEFSNVEDIFVTDTDEVPKHLAAFDIGPKTVASYAALCASAKLILWNGPLGVFEVDVFSKGTFSLAQGVADSAAFSVIGGGDSVAAINQSGLSDHVDHISTGGGAFLTALEGKPLPGVVGLINKDG